MAGLDSMVEMRVVNEVGFRVVWRAEAQLARVVRTAGAQVAGLDSMVEMGVVDQVGFRVVRRAEAQVERRSGWQRAEHWARPTAACWAIQKAWSLEPRTAKS